MRMENILVHNLDFIFLFYGIAFFFLGAVFLLLFFREKEKKGICWLCIAIFSFLYGFHIWLDMLAISFMNPSFLVCQRNFLMGISSLFLIQFFRRSMKFLKNISVSAVVFLPFVLIFLFLLLTQKGHMAFTSFARYFLVLPVLMGVSYIFIILSSQKSDKKENWIFSLGAIFFSLYAFFAGFIAPKVNFFIGSWLNNESFLTVTHVPIQLVRSILATIIAFFFIYIAAKRSSNIRGSNKVIGSVRIILISFSILYIFFLLLGAKLIWSVEQYERQNLKRIVMSDAKLLANTFKRQNFENFLGTRNDAVYQQYLRMHRQMLELADTSSFAKSLYLIIIDKDNFSFAIGSQSQVFPQDFMPAFGSDIPKKAILDALNSRRSTIAEYQNFAGQIASTVFIPFLNNKDGSSYVLGMDLNADKIDYFVYRSRLYAIFVTFLFLVILIVGYIFLLGFALNNFELEAQKDNLHRALGSLKETELELARSEETFRGILNNSPNAIFGFDRDLKIIYWNLGATKLYGFQKESVINEKNPVESKKITDLLGMEGMNSAIEKVFQRETIECETVHKTKDGHVDVMMTLFPVKDPKGNILFGMGLVQDMTEHKLMEHKILEERNRLSRIASSIGAGLILINKDFDVVWVNEIMESWFGGLNSLKGKRCYEAFRFRDRICQTCPSKKTFETKSIQSCEQQVVFPDGRKMDFLLICSPLKNEKGEIDHVLSLVLDMTEKRKMIELIEYERTLSKNVFNSISDALMLLDCKTKIIIDVNKVFLERVRLTKEEVLGKRCDEVYSHFCPTCVDCNYNEVAHQGKTIISTHIHQDFETKSSVYTEVALSPLKDEKGKIIGVIHLAKDITQRRRLEDSLRHYSERLESLVKDRTIALEKSELMFRKLFESSQDGILIIDADNGKIIDINPFLLDLLNYSKDRLINVDYRHVPCFMESKSLMAAFDELKEKMSVFCDDIVLKIDINKDITVEIWLSYYFAEGKKIIQCNIRNVTEKRRLERIKSEFVSMVSHELRTPLSCIKEGVEIVADGTQGKLNKDQQSCLNIALSNIKRLNRLVGDILDIAKIQSDLLKINLLPYRVDDAIEQVCGLARIEMEKRGLLLVVNIEKNLPLVLVDKDRLIQILMNLLNNAIKFTSENSRITISCHRFGEFVEFNIKDQGAGLPPEETVRLFGKFVQLDSTLVRRTGGTGLGLFICRNLVEAIGGEIWVESEVGKGSVFSFRVPIHREGI